MQRKRRSGNGVKFVAAILTGRCTSYRIGVDIGGTFTDCVVVDDRGQRAISKALTTDGALYHGVIDAVTVNAEERGFSLEALLTDTTQFVHGTTVATNAVLTRRGAKTGLITTRGHEDALIIGKVFAKSAGLDERELIHASQLPKPDPIVQPEHIFGVAERIDVEGEILAPHALVHLDDCTLRTRAAGQRIKPLPTSENLGSCRPYPATHARGK